MAKKVLRIHPSRGFFLDAGFHLVNPEKPQVVLPDTYEAPAKVLTAIKNGTLIDVNGNIAVKKVEEKPVEEKKEETKAPTKEEAPAEDSKEEEAQVEAKEEKKETKSKKKPSTKK